MDGLNGLVPAAYRGDNQPLPTADQLEDWAAGFWVARRREDRETVHPYARKLFVLATAFRLLQEDERACRLARKLAEPGWSGTADDLVHVVRTLLDDPG